MFCEDFLWRFRNYFSTLSITKPFLSVDFDCHDQQKRKLEFGTGILDALLEKSETHPCVLTCSDKKLDQVSGRMPALPGN